MASHRSGRLAEDGSAYSQGDLFAPEQPAPPSPGRKAADAAARAAAAVNAGPGPAAVSDDLKAGLSGDWAALAREIDAKGRASQILPQLVTRQIPYWNPAGTRVETPADVHALMLPIRSPYFESLNRDVADRIKRKIGTLVSR